MKTYRFRYGRGEQTFSLDPALVIDELTIKRFPEIADPAAAVREAIRHPIGAPPLREIVKAGQSVAFIVNDPTRVARSDVFMPILLDELNAVGVPDANMRIVFSLGTHRAMTPAEMTAEVGPTVSARVKMHNTDCFDDSQFAFFGTTSRGTKVGFNKLVTEVDHIICTGSIVHHFFAGYGGGRKALLPGVAAYETIRHNHSMMFDPNAVIGRLEGNPVYLDQIEGAEMCRPSFLLNVVLDEDKRFLKVFAGDYISAHKTACTFVDQVYGAEVKREADLVIASCGGYPKDINVYQLQKTMDNAWCAVREGGVVIILGECCEGSGSAHYEQMMRECKTPEQVEAVLRAKFEIGAHKAYAVTRLMKKAEFILVSGMDPDLSRMLLFTPARTFEQALAWAYEKLGPTPTITLMPMGALTVPLNTTPVK
ncbi:MAG TPA: nickel-dependent lactate racemase [Candidatus Methylomirabilis sp.]|nr:nickel-dependent lactate racemase [Candidatus Methylomirabilis sp.]